jgi:hypothetical protein
MVNQAMQFGAPHSKPESARELGLDGHATVDEPNPSEPVSVQCAIDGSSSPSGPRKPHALARSFRWNSILVGGACGTTRR